MKRSVKAIRKQYAKSMKTEADLHDRIRVLVETTSSKHNIAIRFVDKRRHKTLYLDGTGRLTTRATSQPLGFIRIRKVGDTNYYSVAFVEAAQGYGPLLYEIAMEYATQHGSGLTADIHGDTTEAALNVWDKFHKERSDVSRELMLNRTTAKDNIQFRNPTSVDYIYSKQPERINKLREVDLLVDDIEE